MYIAVVWNGPMLRVFLVDDSPLIRKRVRSSLEKIGKVRVVGETTTADESIRTIKEKKPDVVIIDIRLAGGSGIEVLDGCSNGSYDPVKIVLTNYPEKPIKFYSMISGADYFLDKSKDFGKLKEIVRQLVS